MPTSDLSMLMDLSRAMVAVTVRSLRAAGPVPLPQYRALVVLKQEGPCNAGDLAEAVGMHVSTITRICDRLVANHLITRRVAANSRREVELAITPSGDLLVDKVWSARSSELARALATLTVDERAGLRAALPSLLSAFGEAGLDGIEHALA